MGLDNIDLEEAQRREIEVRNTPGVSAVSVAELTMGLLLSAASEVAFGHEQFKAGVWAKKTCNRVELHGKTLGIVGYGGIGEQVARRGAAFGMNIEVCDPRISSFTLNSQRKETIPFQELLSDSEFISLHVPAIPATRGMIDAGAFARMRKCRVLVNTSRDSVVDAGALFTVLETSPDFYYATDVPPGDSTSCQHRRMIATPHIGAQTPENLTRTAAAIVETVKQFQDQTV